MCRCFVFYKPLCIIKNNSGCFKRKNQKSRVENTKYGVAQPVFYIFW